jgi:hypothetical protein
MPRYDAGGRAVNNRNVAVAAGQTTAQISVSGRCQDDYLERVIITQATTAVGAVNVFDGTTSILLHNAQVTGYLGSNVHVYDIGTMCTSTKGFVITTGSSVTCVAVGWFNSVV